MIRLKYLGEVIVSRFKAVCHTAVLIGKFLGKEDKLDNLEPDVVDVGLLHPFKEIVRLSDSSVPVTAFYLFKKTVLGLDGVVVRVIASDG